MWPMQHGKYPSFPKIFTCFPSCPLGISFCRGPCSDFTLVLRGVFSKKDGNYCPLQCLGISQLFVRLQWKKKGRAFLSPTIMAASGCHEMSLMVTRMFSLLQNWVIFHWRMELLEEGPWVYHILVCQKHGSTDVLRSFSWVLDLVTIARHQCGCGQVNVM